MKVYGHPMSTCTRKVLCTLAEKGAEADLLVIDLMKGDHKKGDHLHRHPFGVVPVLVDDDGFELYESRAIVRYLDQKLPGPALQPASLRERGRMDQWISVEQSYVAPHIGAMMRELFFKPRAGQEPDQVTVGKARGCAAAALDVIERHLASSAYLAGDGFSLAEVCFMPYLDYIDEMKEGELLRARPSVAAWWGRLRERPSWKRVTGKLEAGG